ncbi:GDP-mannose-dependent alpha-(1-6)-phosphatidylinositol monomannoside mannosyltransferase [Corynebacterium kalinowskii]|uniref:GDP-mannose-dependent alpha-(1-6)-phosphatidylinositol monomannoside mannosyltransferase n=1 Tax=Corynebacterium kalinowskii TaxID=2675216 RepID=A0A6B8V9U9_9CORY|nr:glycosyltransferase family 4 protein [Corynebacterium kalinowskii]QGU01133.1 GDP-mannose-dependent alpha-(1-6)-phosphatidylinositol monomannoside mannosyltransferase [Corynebacterium kalinowskii]
MNILLLCWRDTEHPQGGGSERYLERVAEYLAAQGHRVRYRTASIPGQPHRQYKGGVQFLRRGGRMSVYVTAALEMLLGRYRDVDVVVDTQNGIPFFATWWLRRPTVVLTHHCHREQWPVAGPFLARVGWFLESRIAPWAYRASQYITVSEPSAQELTELGVASERISIVRNGLDPLPVFEPLKQDDKLHLVTLSRLVPHKQIEHAMDVVAALSPQHYVVLDVIGSGWWEKQLRDYAKSIGVSDRVIFHGHVSEQTKHALLDRAAVQLMPSRKEGWGLAVMEAGQHAVPTIGYRHSAGLRDSIHDGRTGILVRDKAELIRATFDLITDPECRENLGRAAQERSAEFSWELTGQQVLDVLERVQAGSLPPKQASSAAN